jgi:UDP-galactopyranose mutase
VQFIGRCGTYQYLDMHQVINQSLAGARRWLAHQGAAPLTAAAG